MSTLYYAAVSIHLLAALLWLGGMFFLGAVGAPVLRSVQPAALRQQLFHQLGTRFRSIGWVAIGVLVATGVLILELRGMLRWSGVLGSSEFWASGFGHALAAKLVAVVAMIVASLVHDFIIGPAAGRAPAGSPRSLVLRRRAALLARANAIVGIIVVLAAVRLARG